MMTIERAFSQGKRDVILTQDEGDRQQIPTFENKMKKKGAKILVFVRFHRRGTHKNHKTAELPSEFLVSSTPSSIATGRSDMEQIPMRAKMTKSVPPLFALTEQRALR